MVWPPSSRDRDLERRARPQRGFFEEQRNVQSLERLFVAPVRGASRLELGRSREARRYLDRVEVRDR